MSQRAGIPLLISCVTSGKGGPRGAPFLHVGKHLFAGLLRGVDVLMYLERRGYPSARQCGRQHSCCVVELVEALVQRTDPGFHLERVRSKSQLRALPVLSAPSLPGHPRGVNRSAPLLLCYLGISWADALLFSSGSRKSFKTLLQ